MQQYLIVWFQTHRSIVVVVVVVIVVALMVVVVVVVIVVGAEVACSPPFRSVPIQ